MSGVGDVGGIEEVIEIGDNEDEEGVVTIGDNARQAPIQRARHTGRHERDGP